MMKLLKISMLSTLLVLPVAAARAAGNTVDIHVVDIIPAQLSAETNQDSESTIAVNPMHTNMMAASAFTPDPAASKNSPIFYTRDGGRTWILSVVLPGASPTLPHTTNDVSLQFGGAFLYAASLDGRYGADHLHLDLLRKEDIASPTVMERVVSHEGLDQPWVTALPVKSDKGRVSDHVFISSNDIAHLPNTARVEFSNDATAKTVKAGGFKALAVEKDEDAVGSQDAPAVRTAPHPDGTVYEAHIAYLNQENPTAANIVVRRDDAWGSRLFGSLKDPTGKTRVIVAANVSLPALNERDSYLGCQRVNSALSIAVNPKSSNEVYVAWGDGETGDAFTLHVRRSTDRGVHWGSDLLVKKSSINPALAINGDGIVGYLYQSLDPGTDKKLRDAESGSTAFSVCSFGKDPSVGASWSTYFDTTNDGFKTIRHSALARHAPELLPISFDPELGDFDDVVAVGDTFYGIFSSCNDPARTLFSHGDPFQRFHDLKPKPGSLPALYADAQHTRVVVPSVDPFFFKARIVQ